MESVPNQNKEEKGDNKFREQNTEFNHVYTVRFLPHKTLLCHI